MHPARAGTRWCSVWKDFPAARASGVPMSRWVPWMLGCEAKSAVSWDDPMPLVRSLLHRVLAKASVKEAAAPLQPSKQAG
jgi:D-aspartate ligase